MQILYCDVCGAKLPELDVPTNVEKALCKDCAVTHQDPLEMLTQIPVSSDPRKSSSIHLTPVKPSSGSNPEPSQVPVGTDARKASSIRLRAVGHGSGESGAAIVPTGESSRRRSSSGLHAIKSDTPSGMRAASATGTHRRRSSARLRSVTGTRRRVKASALSAPSQSGSNAAPRRSKARRRRGGRNSGVGAQAGTLLVILLVGLGVFLIFDRNRPKPSGATPPPPPPQRTSKPPEASKPAPPPNDQMLETETLKKSEEPPAKDRQPTVEPAPEQQTAYESAMNKVEELLAARNLKEAATALEQALQAKPDDEKAVALLAEVRRQLQTPIP